MNNIILTGFMGSGKSTLGRILAKELKMEFLDTDSAVEAQENMTISELFEQKGEAYFRSAETTLLQNLADRGNMVIAVGGGTPLLEENRDELHKIGTVFYLKMDSETAWTRLKNDKGRPLLQVENPKERISELLEARSPIYENGADVVICEENKDINQIMKEVMAEVKKDENISN